MFPTSYAKKEDIPKGQEDGYVEVDGAWVIEGFAPKGKVDEFRNNNITLTKKIEEQEKQLLKFKDVDPVKYADAHKKLQELENNRLADAGEWKVLQANLERQHAEEIQESQKQAKSIQKGWDLEKIANRTAMTVLQHAVPGEGNMKYIQGDIQDLFSIDPESGEIIMKDKKTGLPVKNEAKDGNLTLEEYLTKTYIPGSNLFQKSEGGGAMGNRNANNLNKGIVDINDINGREISGQNLEDLASGTLKAE